MTWHPLLFLVLFSLANQSFGVTCPDDWLAYEPRNKCFKAWGSYKSWDDCQAYCAGFNGGSMICIHDAYI